MSTPINSLCNYDFPTSNVRHWLPQQNQLDAFKELVKPSTKTTTIFRNCRNDYSLFQRRFSRRPAPLLEYKEAIWSAVAQWAKYHKPQQVTMSSSLPSFCAISKAYENGDTLKLQDVYGYIMLINQNKRSGGWFQALAVASHITQGTFDFQYCTYQEIADAAIRNAAHPSLEQGPLVTTVASFWEEDDSTIPTMLAGWGTDPTPSDDTSSHLKKRERTSFGMDEEKQQPPKRAAQGCPLDLKSPADPTTWRSFAEILDEGTLPTDGSTQMEGPGSAFDNW